jgi:modulator of FtsH protease
MVTVVVEATSGWSDFLVAAAGASGALVGLVFVALSINLNRIIDLPGVATRGAETILLLASVLVGSLAALVPRLSAVQLTLVFFGLWLSTWAPPTIIQIRAIKARRYHRLSFAIWRFMLHQLATFPLLLTALALHGLISGGLNWYALAVLVALIVALVSAWVLLVEIVR